MIEKDEAIDAVIDYFNGVITKEQAIDIRRRPSDRRGSRRGSRGTAGAWRAQPAGGRIDVTIRYEAVELVT